MTEGIEAVTLRALSLALDAASLRQQAVATNIANARTVGYVPQRVSFESQLADVRSGLRQNGRIDAFALSPVLPHLETAVGDNGIAGVRLDVEAAEMARNAVHYQALVKGLSGHLAVLSMAASDGRK